MSVVTDKFIAVNPSPTGQLTSSGGDLLPTVPTDLLSDHLGEQLPGVPNTIQVQAVENDDPLRRRIVNPTRHGFLVKLLRWIKRVFYHIPSKEELAELEDRKQRVLMTKQLTAESRVAEGRLINCLTRMQICYKTINNKTTRIRKVAFNKVLMEPNALWFRVNIHRLPYGVSIAQLTDQDTVDNLSMSVGHKVSVRWREDCGLWYIIERASGTMGLPNHVQIMDMWDKMPESKDSLTIPVGISNNSRIVYQSLDDMTHALIAGTTGGGKSNFLNVILCTLIRRNKPDRLKLLMVDLKGGLEFNYYSGIPHLIQVPVIAPTGIIYDRDGVGELLNWVIGEGEKRMKILLDAGAKNIGEYNAHRRKNYMAQWVLVIDEWADVKLGRDGKEIENRLANAVQRMRAVGIHVLLCTQVPQSQVIGTLIKANMPAKFAFSCADLQGSMAILNNGHALNLQPRGRCIFRFQDEIAVQTPYIAKGVITDTVQGALTGKFGESLKRHDVSEEEIRDWAIKENNGWLQVSRLYDKYRLRGLPQGELIAWLQSWEGKEFIIGSFRYRVENKGGPKGRRLVAIQDED